MWRKYTERAENKDRQQCAGRRADTTKPRSAIHATTTVGDRADFTPSCSRTSGDATAAAAASVSGA